MDIRMTKEVLINNIKEICKERGISVSQLEANLGFSQGLISRWVRMSPSIDKVLSVADELEVSLDRLTGRSIELSSQGMVEALYEDSKKGKLIWKPDGCGKTLTFPVIWLQELYGLNVFCGYCNYDTSYFVLAGNQDDDSIEIWGLYVLIDEGSVPTRLNIDAEDLLPLYDLIKDQIILKGQEERVKDFCSKFLRMRGK